MRIGLAACLTTLFLAACGDTGGHAIEDGQVYAPSLDPKGQSVDGLLVGHRLMAAGEHELALEAYLRAAGQDGLDGEVLTSLGSANLALGRLGQAEHLLRQAIKLAPDWPEAWNNLGVVLMEAGKVSEASEVFRRAYALDNGQSDAIRDNLRLALAKLENPGYSAAEQEDFQLIREGTSTYLIQRHD
ncbi:tetratricopeptide repeat protein [Citreicella sp. C3M06]|uniref:tetratricopeptide repeat protein n=1 Tax=Roseobacteraceae TaxID=2854170 RepID=UPI001C08980F|nr:MULTISPECIES: tetratricopeptide repeat protein [Roseobacteraceae]MBU2960875.1 tetratricopeptide repeat protein [Citreicella sp. C3M06]MDO6584389.1 tetratricopeptide repeat protein [Salipiger sp. 1_MG-2023]